ncbi:MAG: hypothetical protein ACE5HU_10415 [Acidobacteriota bacterium]
MRLERHEDHRWTEIRSFCDDLTGLLGEGGHAPGTILAVKDRLAALIAHRPRLPEQMRTPHTRQYSRHLLYADPTGRFEVVVMAWSPGQETPVHDHAGIWCVEGVVEGTIQVSRYDLKGEIQEDVAHLEEREVIRAGLGRCGALIPPVEYHRIANPYEELALTIHVYGGRMRRCRVFERQEGNRYRVRSRALRFSNAGAALAPA